MFLKALAEANLLPEIGLFPKIEPTIMRSSCDNVVIYVRDQNNRLFSGFLNLLL